MKAGLFQQQTLKMTMTQELTQAITLLQYSAQELSEFLENKILENPILSLEEPSSAYPLSFGRKKRKRNDKKFDSNDWIEQVSEDTSSLERHILSQVHLNKLSKDEYKGLLFLIRNLDENGYLRIRLEDISLPGVTEEMLDKCLEILHQAEPYGIGARDLQECLWLQAYADGESPLAELILEKYFLEFAERRWKELSKKIGVSMKEIQDVSDYVQTLSPRPASGFHQEKSSYIIPDVVVEYKSGQWLVGHTDGTIPVLTVDQGYMSKLKSYQDPGVQRFIQDKMQEYHWIAKGIQQRKETIVRVMRCIVARQPECFYYGMDYLKPMVMKEVADELGIHESTVSRAVKGKYVQTQFGTIEMRNFFTVSLPSVNQEEDVSGQKAKKLLADFIQGEDKRKPLSDQELMKRLKNEHGLLLARRTVAKYREQLGIPSSTKRKRYD
ncbi:RNA polymerase factor sigma-54 [Bacillus massiliglaciei]|uniref:RNA polymerase factor sigma-54 n=1 Tax=Bacillus massiliglaciei TaxID=1816693 RepID=UPI001F22F483|nr:RNA polymerase factor sigma-54 [Bacillus massiliglaciei]